MRIAIAGFQHETNTFVAQTTGIEDFLQADSWPEFLNGDAVVEVTRGMNLPVAGFVQAAADADTVEILPILWCSAEPGGCVTDHAFELVTEQIVDTLTQIGSVDAVYLDLHGAMVTQSHDDGEGELLSRVRSIIGPDVALIASLDLHANVTEKMVATADILTIYRTYPHLDMAETGARAFRMLQQLSPDAYPAKAWRQADYLVPLHAQHTGADPARALYQLLKKHEGPEVQLAELALGFTASDIHDAGPSVLAYANTQAQADAIADDMLAHLAAAEMQFETALLSPETAVSQALAISAKRPVIIADAQDNPGAGASSDTTGLLRELMRQKADNTLLGLVYDPELAYQAHKLGKDDLFEAEIGGRGPGDDPLVTNVRVHHLSNGEYAYTGAMYGGGIGSLGLSAALKLDGTSIFIVVTSIRNQCLDLAQFRHFNLSPETARILCVKSTAHFRADFQPIAQEVLLAAAPGQFPCMLDTVPYKNLRGHVRRCQSGGSN